MPTRPGTWWTSSPRCPTPWRPAPTAQDEAEGRWFRSGQGGSTHTKQRERITGAARCGRKISVRSVFAWFGRRLGFGPEEQMADLSGRVLGDYVLREKVGGGGYG